MSKLVSKFKFAGCKQLQEVKKQAKAHGFKIDTEEFDQGGDWIWLRRMNSVLVMPLQVKYNTCNGRFFAWTQLDAVRSYTESSTEMEGEDWYKELLLLFYRPDVQKGDKVTIFSRGIRVTGEVVSVEWYEESGWMMELSNANVPGAYSRWKQRDDGGFIVEWEPASEGSEA